MSINSRLNRLEQRLKPDREDPYADWYTEEQWLEIYRDMGERGMFENEPDFPTALNAYRQALEDAGADFDPPTEFMSTLPRPLRLLNWRNASRFPAVRAAAKWLGEILSRVGDDVPPVTVEEFETLAAWLTANESELRGIEWLELRYGGRTHVTNLIFSAAQGPRDYGAGKVAANLRQLRAEREN